MLDGVEADGCELEGLFYCRMRVRKAKAPQQAQDLRILTLSALLSGQGELARMPV
jgi:hypothetical protein